MKLSIIIPVYNEENTLDEIVRRILKVKLPVKKEIIIVDDASKDESKSIEKELSKKHDNIRIINHPKNLGKGNAIRTGLKYATGDMIIIQDADLEYNPEDYKDLIKPIVNKKARVVYGSRNLGKNKGKHSYLSFYIGGIVLSKLANLLYGTKITDEATCYKLFEAGLIKNMNLKCKRFEFCPEVTAKIAKIGIEIVEVPIFYNPRSKKEGKKLGWVDGVEAILTLIKYKFRN
jgi:dolichol-phosphate mannosyltransferase